jgi:hypothetical protein
MVGTVMKRVVSIVRVIKENVILLPDIVKRDVDQVGFHQCVHKVNSIYK